MSTYRQGSDLPKKKTTQQKYPLLLVNFHRFQDLQKDSAFPLVNFLFPSFFSRFVKPKISFVLIRHIILVNCMIRGRQRSRVKRREVKVSDRKDT